MLRVIASVAAVWLCRHGLVAAVPGGSDVDGHVARTAFAHDLFAHGRLDGWFPTFGSGYRLFAVYGPGLAMASGAVRLASFGTLDVARSLAVVGVASMALLPWAVSSLSRELGSTRTAAAIHGVAALAVSFRFGGGLAGLYGSGLIPQGLALPVQLWTLAGGLRVARHHDRRAMAGIALGVAALAVLHPISLLVLAIMGAPLVAVLCRPVSWPALARVAGAGAWGAAVAGWWLLPALANAGHRGGVSAWTTPPLPTRLADIARGEAVFPRAVAVAVGLALAVTAGEALRSGRARRRLVPPVVAGAYLVVTHLAEGHRIGPVELRIQFPTEAWPSPPS